jgi:hypothetical protein
MTIHGHPVMVITRYGISMIITHLVLDDKLTRCRVMIMVRDARCDVGSDA